MKTGLGIRRKLLKALVFWNFLRFKITHLLFGFETALLILSMVDKGSLKYILVKYGAKIGDNCDLQTGMVFHNCSNFDNLEIGNNVHIGKCCFFDLRDKIKIQDNVVIAMRCEFITHQDITKSGLSDKYPASQAPIKVGNDAYIGARSILLSGTSVEQFSIIAAGSVVHQNIDSFWVYGGVPARKLKPIK